MIGTKRISTPQSPFLFSPKNSTPLICIYGAGSTGKTTAVFELVKLGYNITYLDLNHKPQFEVLPPEFWGKVNYLKIKNIPGTDYISQTITALSSTGAAEICAEHGAKGCSTCKSNGSPVFNLNLKKLENTVFVIDEATTYVDLQLEQSLSEVISGAAMEEYAILSGKMAKFYNFLKKIPVPSIVLAHEVEVGADLLRSPNMGGPKAGIIYPLLGSSTKSKTVGTPTFSHVIRTIKKSKSAIGTAQAVQYKQTGVAFANVGALEDKVSSLPLHQALDIILAGKGKAVESVTPKPTT